MKTSTWVTLACIVVSVAFIGLMLGLWAVPAKETETAPTTSTETSVSSGGSAKIQQEPANVNRSENKPESENFSEERQNEPAAEDLNDGENAEDLNDGENQETEKRGE